MSRHDGAQTEGSTPMSKWPVLPIIVLAYIATSATATAPRDRDHDRLPDRWERHHHLSTAIPSAKRDPDSDRLTNRRELRLRTHPRHADSDRDRLRDGAEVRRFHTNPRRWDTDGDHLSDWREIRRVHTNPRKRDTDGDGFWDRCELRSGTNPRNRTSRPIRRCSDPPPEAPGRAPAGGGGEFPNASNTGVPAGANLAAYTGPATITTDGTVIEGKRISDCLIVRAADVVIRNSFLECGIYHEDDGDPSSAFLIHDSVIECAGTGGTGLNEADFTARRVEVRSCENGASINRDVTIEDSWIHALENGGNDPHEDGVQLSFAYLVGSNWLDGSTNTTLRHNTIEGINKDGSQGTSAIITNPDDGYDKNTLIENNLLIGGGTVLYCARPGQAASDFRILNNRFDPTPGYGLDDDCGDETHSGNVLHDTGQPVTFDDH
jgi:Bacterial TSP3 repeat